VLVLVAGIVGLLCLGGAGVVFVLYEQQTRVDRGSPDAAVDNYLRAALVQRDDAQAALYTCDHPSLGAVRALRDEIVRREADFGVKVAVTWGALAVKGEASAQRTVDVDLTIAGIADGQTRSRRTESWSFEVVDQGGWRVCGAARVS
jgi:hypothetical protein